MLLRAGATIHVFNDTADEAFHITSAVSFIETHRDVMGIETPPVDWLVMGGALRAAGLWNAQLAGDRTIRDNNATATAATRVLVDGGLPYWRILEIARGASMLFGAAALVYVYFLGRWAGGPLVGMLATVFVSTDPTLLAHSALATTDAAATAGFLAATYHGLRWLIGPTVGRAAAAGAATGIAVGCKFTCLALVPALVILTLWRWYRTRRSGSVQKLPTLGQAILLAGTTLAVLWACYLFDIGRMSDSEMMQQGQWARIPKFLARSEIPMPSFPLGVLMIFSHSRAGLPCYLNGQLKTGGWWYYFPEALALKSPSALLVGLALAAILAIYRVRRGRLCMAILIYAISLFVLAMSGRIQTGVRYLLPMIPLFYILVCAQMARPRWVWVLVGLIAASFAETCAKHPDYLSFFNVFAGGVGERYLLDSNLDWGQDVGRLAHWLQTEKPNTPYETRIWGPMSHQPLPDPHFRVNDVLNLRSGLFIVDENVKWSLCPVWDDRYPGERRRLTLPAWIFQREPVKRIGDSIEVYDIPAQGAVDQ
jgi:hypothetical protein